MEALRQERAATRARSLSVVIPAFNEEARLPETLPRIHSFLAERAYDAEIIVVDDGSRDRTSDRVNALRPSLPMVRLRTHSTNTGKDFAVFAGVREATREAILFTDADLSTPIEDVERLWNAYDRGVDVVIGSRRHPDSEIPIAQPANRRIMGHVFSGMVSLLCIRGIRDTQCGFKLFRTEVLRRIIPRLRTQGFAFDVEMLMKAREMGLPIAEVGVRWSDDRRSRIRPIRDGSRMLLQLLRMKRLI
jgi:dolichyl-phosphate beta-glucosyltransferase